METIHFQRDGGTGNMGDVTTIGAQDDTVGRIARFRLPGRFALSFARVHFGGSGTGTATLSLKVDSHAGALWDCTIWEWTGAGKGADINHRIPKDEQEHFTFEAGDELVFEWTNPDSGNITWGIEVGLKDASGP
jgi:hypothetical protein